jgi:hypothetical protein
MKLKAFVALLCVCCFAYAADTTAALSGATRSTQFVTAVDHTKLVSGNTSVVARQDGTVSIVISSGQQSVTNTVATTAQIPYDYVSAATATNIAKAIIRERVSGLSTNLQTAEDTRVAVSNLITILKNL